jgi:hypothetical protein
MRTFGVFALAIADASTAQLGDDARPSLGCRTKLSVPPT